MKIEPILDLEHDHEPTLSDLPIKPGTILRLPLLAVIRLYQVTISRASSGKHLPVLSILLPLWVSSDL